MVQLEHGIKIDGKEYFIILDNDGADELERNWLEYQDIKALYISKDVLLTTAKAVIGRAFSLMI